MKCQNVKDAQNTIIWKVAVKIVTMGQFHQHSTSSFCACRSRKHIKTVKFSVFFVISWSARAKAAPRTLLKLSPYLSSNLSSALQQFLSEECLFREPKLPWVNFINILCKNFSYESLLSSFSLLRVWLWTNFCTKNVLGKCWWNWHLLSFDKFANCI